MSPHLVTGAGALTLALVLSPACAARRAPVTKAESSVAVRLAPLPTLRAELEQLFNAPALARATWGVLIQSLDTGETLFALNPNKYVMPASSMKIVTLAAAAERLGWDYRFTTDIATTGTLDPSSGVLDGDLIVVGRGDPTINGRGGPPTRVFDEWARRLREMGIREISGRIIGDDDAFDEESLGAGWSWDYLGYGYAAPIGALEFNEDVVEVTMHPGSAPGDVVGVEVSPPEAGITIVNHLATGTPGASPDLELRRLPGRNVLELYGTVPAKLPAYTLRASVDNPTLLFVRTLRSSLIAGGIAVRGDAVDVDDLETPTDRLAQRTLFTHDSAPLREIARVLMKVSQNLYAETLLKTLGTLSAPLTTTAGGRLGPAAAAGGDGPQPAMVVRGTAEGGRRVVRDVLASWGIPPDSVIMYDGSGLSRANAVTPELLVRLLRQMYIAPKHQSAFIESLPIGGIDGTLGDRFRGTRAESNVHAKTGSIANVRSLSGYVRTQDDELIAFSIIANNFNSPQSAVDAVTDRVVDRLARFSRR
jgi:D-alanyl-D-alanine carboxypeptidase/D-alanyl-D-alanine-endopeptidase (penicillin-binding protein 4)